jgi:uncharacterized protein VirK/YbjX
MIKTFRLLLAWEQFYNAFNKRSDVDDSAYATLRLMKRILEHIPREYKSREGSYEGSHGWHILKFHVKWYIWVYVLKMSCMRASDTGVNEKNHKVFVKRHYNKTQKILSKFTAQVAENEHCIRIIP